MSIESVMKTALVRAKKQKSQYLTVEHVFDALLERQVIINLFGIMQWNISAAKKSLKEFLLSNFIPRYDLDEKTPKKTRAIERVLKTCYLQAQVDNVDPKLSLEHLLLSIIQEDETAAQDIFFSSSVGGSKEALFNYMKSKHKMQHSVQQPTRNAEPAIQERAPSSNEETFLVNMNDLVKSGDITAAIGRDKEISKLELVLNRKNKKNAVLIGDPGVGKTKIVEGLVYKIENDQVDHTLRGATVYSLDISALVAGTMYRGDFENRMQILLKQLKQRRSSILFIDELHSIMGAGSAGKQSLDVANILKPAMARGEIRVIGSTTQEEYRKHIEPDKAFTRRSLKINIEEPSVPDTIHIIEGCKSELEIYHRVTIPSTVVEHAVNLSEKYIYTRKFPDKAIDILDICSARVKMLGRKQVSKEDIEKEVAEVSGLGTLVSEGKENEVLLGMEDEIKKLVYGQDQGISQVSKLFKIFRSGLRPLGKVASSAMLIGSTGTGKTFLTQSIANYLKLPFVRIDMSEFSQEFTVSSLIGSPPGYKGFDEGSNGRLVDEIEKNPRCVLLLDEVEKAHPKVLTILLQIMDSGILTSSSGKEISFEHVHLFMTSNLGAREAESNSNKNPLGFIKIQKDNDTSFYHEEYKKFFSPEFRARVDAVINFSNHTFETLSLITKQKIADLNNTLTKFKSSIIIKEEAKNKIISNALESNQGARPILALIDSEIKPQIADLILSDKIHEKNLCINYQDDKFEVSINE